jgi:hypothetical protein
MDTKTKLILSGVCLLILFIIFLFLVSSAVYVYYYYKVDKEESENENGYFIAVEGEIDEAIPEANRVIAFDKENYLSKLTSFTPGKFILINKADNNIASLKVPEGYEVHLYDDNNFKKEIAVYRKDINLPLDIQYKTSSISVSKI